MIPIWLNIQMSSNVITSVNEVRCDAVTVNDSVLTIDDAIMDLTISYTVPAWFA